MTIAVTMAVCAGLSVVPAAAQRKPEPPKAEAPKQYEDWVHECEASPNQKQTCFISQSMMAGDGTRLIKISIGPLGPKGETYTRVMLPLGIYLPAGAAYQVGGTPQVHLVIHTCMPEGCLASAPISPAALKAFGDGKTFAIGVVPTGSDKAVTIGVSVKGFKAALASLK